MTAVLVMAKAPVAGRVKSRLQPAFTARECAQIQEALIARTLRWALELAPGRTVLAHDGPGLEVPPGVTAWLQHGNDSGERLANATQSALAAIGTPLIVVGVDVLLEREHAEAALAQLEAGAAAVFGPSSGGGYYLLALREPLPELFEVEEGDGVLERTLQAAWGAGHRTALIRPETELDALDDLPLFEHDPDLRPLLRRVHEPLVSVVVPAHDDAGKLPAVLDHLAALEGRFETIVVDGGSSDATALIAAVHPSAPLVLRVTGDRAAQLNAGADAARGDAVVFLDPDSRLPPDAYRTLTAQRAEQPPARRRGPWLFVPALFMAAVLARMLRRLAPHVRP